MLEIFTTREIVTLFYIIFCWQNEFKRTSPENSHAVCACSLMSPAQEKPVNDFSSFCNTSSNSSVNQNWFIFSSQDFWMNLNWFTLGLLAGFLRHFASVGKVNLSLIHSDELNIFSESTVDSLWGIYGFVWASNLIVTVLGVDMFC